MKLKHPMHLFLAAATLAVTAWSTQAQILITEVHPTGSSSAYGADWFEIRNTGFAPIDLTGWKMDDSSATFASAVNLRSSTNLVLGGGQLAIFLEGKADGSTDATITANFLNAWFGSSLAPALLGFYGGSGVGLGSGGDGVNLFDSTGMLVTGVSFGSATPGVTFDFTSGSAVPSVSGVSGAFVSADGLELGSPGVVPEPSVVSLALLGITGLMAARRR